MCVLFSSQSSRYDGKRIFELLQAVSQALSDASFSPLPPRIDPAFRCVYACMYVFDQNCPRRCDDLS